MIQNNQSGMNERNRYTWWINIGKTNDIKCYGSKLEQAVENYGRYHPKNKVDGCGLLVEVIHKNIMSYWSGEKFMQCLIKGMNGV